MLFSDMSILLFSADTVLAIASSTDRSSLKPSWMTCNVNFSVLSISVMFLISQGWAWKYVINRSPSSKGDV